MIGAREDMDVVRAVTYGRQSHKSENDSQASPKMQRDTGVSYINSQDGWRHTGHYEDVGLSGYDPNVYRPGFEQMMSDARARKFDVVVIYMLSRLTRQGAAEAMAIQQELAKYGVALVSTQEPFVNTTDDNPFGVALFALVAGLAHQESRNKSKFIRDAFAELKAKGSHSTGPIPYGFRAEYQNVDSITIRRLSPLPPAETGGPNAGDVVRRIITAGLSGQRPNAIAYALTADGTPTPLDSLGDAGDERRTAARARRKTQADAAPGEWSATTVTRILRDPRLAGFAIGPVDPRNKRRTILRDDNDQPVRPHEGFMTPAEWYSLQKVLDGRKREVAKPRSGGPTLLGSWGILRCGKCGSGMTNDNTRDGGSYSCSLSRTVGDAPKHVTRITRNAADEAVARKLWAHLTALDPAEDERDSALLLAASERFAADKADPEAAEELIEQEAHLQHVQESMNQLYADRDSGLYAGPTGRKAFADTVRRYQAFEAETMTRIEKLREAATATVEIPFESWLQDGDNPLGAGSLWAAWDVEERRAFLALWVDSITVLPATTRGVSLADERIEIEWAEPDREDADALH